jgi:peptidoglycan-associated lipoprotein
MLRKLSLALISASLALAVSSCKSAKTTDDSTEIPQGSDTSSTDLPNAGDDNTMGDSDSGKAMGLQTVYFPYDSSNIEGTALATVKGNAEILKAHPTTKIQIEGHCDQRGGIQYNIALGERRANAIRDSLKREGISGDRITTISYGKERILDMNMTEEAFSKNRRGNFVITSK